MLLAARRPGGTGGSPRGTAGSRCRRPCRRSRRARRPRRSPPPRMAVLDLVGDVRDDLHGAPEVVAAPLLLDDRQVDLAGRPVVGPRRHGVREALVVAEVEVGLRAVVGDVDLAVLVRAHRARVDVDVRVELLQRDPVAVAFEQRADRGGGEALAERRDDAAGDEDVLDRSAVLVLHDCLSCGGAGATQAPHPFEIRRGVDPDRVVRGFDRRGCGCRARGRAAARAIRPARAGVGAQAREREQERAPVDVQADVLERERRRRARGAASRVNGIGAREKYSANPARSTTTFTTFGLAKSAGSSIRRHSVAIGSDAVGRAAAPPPRRSSPGRAAARRPAR